MSNLKEEISFKMIAYLVTSYSICTYIAYKASLFEPDPIGPFVRYGNVAAYILLFLKAVHLSVTLPFLIFNVITTVFCDKSYNNRRIEKTSKTICFRVVTRGMFPNLVKKNLEKNLSVLKAFENLKYTYEILTDKEIEIEKIERCSEILIPRDYKTKSGALFKARALQYALERDESKLETDDWIVHLDEETLLTKESINGIIKFINKNQHQIGQGCITYGKCGVVNQLNTLVDSMRVANDLGTLRFSLKHFHRAGMYIKGSFLVCKNDVENLVSFDNGIEGSIAEDAFFVIKATNMGFTLDWIEGEMLEQSPFSMVDLLRQRKRWEQGLLLVAISRNLKRDLARTIYSLRFVASVMLPVGCAISTFNLFNPIKFSLIDVGLYAICDISVWYLMWFGLFHSFNVSQMSIIKLFFYLITTPLWTRYWEIVESIALIWALVTPKNSFAIVKKSFETEQK